MRRARIKVIASVPLRRKVIKVGENVIKNSSEKDLKDVFSRQVPNDDLKSEEFIGEKELRENVVLPSGGNEIIAVEKKIDPDGQETPKVPEVVDNVMSEDKLTEKWTENVHRHRDKSIEFEKTVPTVEAIVPRRPRLFSESSDIRGHHSGSEAVSPTKLQIHQNRTSFMRPTPRLDGSVRIRRNSIHGSGASASESEDEIRRHFTPHPPPSASPRPSYPSQPSTPTPNNPKQKRKILVSESARKLSEARREFLRKHENKIPERTKLTMYDLIFYNPTTNPMKKTPNSLVNSSRGEHEDVIVPNDDDDDDDDNNDEDSPMPVPQLKVGPNGELIVDEKSLVIENTSLKKNREAVAKRRVLVDEEGAIGGFYKKRTKGRYWTKFETLKFYKALNTVGTDFSLMQSLFPHRTRNELKMKYKKEEKSNRPLVDKALLYHREYDIETLKKEFQSYELTEDSEMKKKSTGTLRKRRAKRNVATSINLQSEDEDEPQENDVYEGKDSKISKNDQQVNSNNEEIPRVIKRKKLEAKEVVKHEVSISDDYFDVCKAKPTRSGRLLTKTSRFHSVLYEIYGDRIEDDDWESVHGSLQRDNEKDENAQEFGESVQGLEDVEHGSLVIVAKESPDEPGKMILQVYMVHKDVDGGGESMTPVNLSSELLSTVTSGLSSYGVNPVKLTLK